MGIGVVLACGFESERTLMKSARDLIGCAQLAGTFATALEPIA